MHYHAFGVPVEAAGVSQSDFERGLRTVPAALESRTIHFIGKDMFVRNELAAGRPKDLADAARLKKTHRP
jgi:hypothetical protein